MSDSYGSEFVDCPCATVAFATIPDTKAVLVLLHLLAALAGCGLLLSGPAAGQQATIAGVPAITDADTFTLGAATIRLHGIDAPEIGQSCERPGGVSWRCDVAATNLLEELIDGGRVTCDLRDVDAYGRLISVCKADGTDLSGALIDAGLAWAFVRYSNDYATREGEARAARVGIWRGGATPTPPWEYRANRWERAAAASPRKGCPIKGNIGSDGERIYHTPWSPWYTRTKVNPSAGERWFCDEAEAIAAGWRPAASR